ncbi:MAG: hypothetical protein ABI837_18715 [Acidobacteriota bacterium]
MTVEDERLRNRDIRASMLSTGSGADFSAEVGREGGLFERLAAEDKAAVLV